jgi:hypothetical protein
MVDRDQAMRHSAQLGREIGALLDAFDDDRPA